MLSTEQNERLTRTGPGTPMGDLFRRFWMPALLSEELPAPDCPPVRLRLLSEDLVAFRNTSGQVGVLAAACSHRRASLFWGRNEEHGLRCVYHGWKFDVDGNCVDMPSEPQESTFKDKMKTTAYPAEDWGGLVWVYMGPSELKPPLPHFDWCVEPSPDQHIYKWTQDSNYAQGLEGNIDSAHVSFLHRWFGITPEYLDDGAPVLSAMETDFGFVYGARRSSTSGGFHWRVTPFVMPLYTVIPNRTGRGAGFFVVPMDDEHSWWFTIQRTAPVDLSSNRGAYVELMPGTFRLTRNKDNDYAVDREMQRTVNFTGLVNNRVQDSAITESMGTVVERELEHLGTSDIAIIFMRRLLARAALDLEQGAAPSMLAYPELSYVLPLDLDSDEPDLARLWQANRDAETARTTSP